ncbi:MAG: stage III sporulation protein AF [Clostridium sp.]|nr:stage III sporulation protein AF [Clostridium sp.]
MLELIRTAGVFMIIAQTMYHFVGGSHYARYVRLLIRIMTLAVLVVPMLDLIKSGTEADFQEQLTRFEQEYEAILRDAEYTGENLVEEQIRQTTAQELRTAVNPVLAAYGYETVSVSAGENGLLFLLRRMDDQTEEIVVNPVREINIQTGGREDPEGGEYLDAQDLKDRLADVIAAYLQTERSWVEVRIVE